MEVPFVPRGHVRLAKACVGYRRSIEYLAWIENAFRVQHPLDIQHQRPLLRVARDWEPCLLLQTDAMFGRDRTANPAQWLIDAAFNLFPVFGAARTNGDVQIAVAHMSKERHAPFMPDRLQPRSDLDHIGFHIAAGQADVKNIARSEDLDDRLKIFHALSARYAVFLRH